MTNGAFRFGDIRLYVLDMDGTLYLSDRLLPGAMDLIEYFREQAVPFLMYTNNSSRSAEDYAAKLNRLKIEVQPDLIMTSADVMVDCLKTRHPGEPVALLGTPACAETFRSAGVELSDDARIAVAAFDTTLTYAKLVRFCDVLRAGAVFYATHPDLNCPVDGGMIPDLGAFLALIEASTGRCPEIVGKPFRPTVAAISRRTGFAPAEMAFVGDRLYTDMAVARNNGAHAVLLMSGETDDAMLAASSIQPDAVFADAAALLEAIRGERP